MFERRGVLWTLAACALPVVAVLALRGLPAAGGPPPLALVAPSGEGLVPLIRRQDLRPGLLSQRYRCVFPLANGTDRAIAITSATTSCGCASLVVPPSIPARSWGEMAVDVVPGGRFGPLEAAVVLRTDDGRPPLRLVAVLQLPPLPRLPSDEARVAPGASSVEVKITGGDENFPVVCLSGPTSGNQTFATEVSARPDGLVLVCRYLDGPRPAAARVRLRVGYDAKHAVDLALRVIAE